MHYYLQAAFTGADVVIMLGAFPRKDGMERKDLLEKNCGIFKEQVSSMLLFCSCSLVENLVPVVCRKVKKKRDIARFFDINEMMHISPLSCLPAMERGWGFGPNRADEYEAPLARASDSQTERPQTAREREREQKRRE